jgi:hypothetical protein
MPALDRDSLYLYHLAVRSPKETTMANKDNFDQIGGF